MIIKKKGRCQEKAAVFKSKDSWIIALEESPWT